MLSRDLVFMISGVNNVKFDAVCSVAFSFLVQCAMYLLHRVLNYNYKHSFHI